MSPKDDLTFWRKIIPLTLTGNEPSYLDRLASDLLAVWSEQSRLSIKSARQIGVFLLVSCRFEYTVANFSFYFPFHMF
jgi:hypothetical protein